MVQPTDTRRLTVQQPGIGKNEAARAGADKPDTLLEGTLKKADGFGGSTSLTSNLLIQTDMVELTSGSIRPIAASQKEEKQLVSFHKNARPTCHIA